DEQREGARHQPGGEGQHHGQRAYPDHAAIDGTLFDRGAAGRERRLERGCDGQPRCGGLPGVGVGDALTLARHAFVLRAANACSSEAISAMPVLPAEGPRPASAPALWGTRRRTNRRRATIGTRTSPRIYRLTI